jgi:hypothetical protein
MEDTQETEQVEEEVVTTEPEPVVEEINIPENWEPDVKDFINSIQDVKGKKAIFDKLKNYETGYQKKFQDLATQRHQLDDDRNFTNSYREFEKNLNPDLRASILAHYGNVPAYMRALHEADITATKDPVKFLLNYCNSNGITKEVLDSYLTGTQSQELKAQKDQDTLRKQIIQEIEEKQQRQRLEDDLRSFANATNENGDLLHPLIQDENFIGQMDKLYSIYPNKSLQELYDMVVWSNPEYREQAVEREAQKIAQAKDVEKAKSAIGVKPSIPSNKSTEIKSWRNVLDDEVGAF